jgi:hypothetical protein
MKPFFSACDACGEPFTSVVFGGRGNVDTALYELCVGCVDRVTTAPELAEQVRRAIELRDASPQGNA